MNVYNTYDFPALKLKKNINKTGQILTKVNKRNERFPILEVISWWMLTDDLHTWSISLDSSGEFWLKLRPALFPVLRESLLSWQIGKKVGIKQLETNSGTIMKVLQRVRFDGEPNHN